MFCAVAFSATAQTLDILPQSQQTTKAARKDKRTKPVLYAAIQDALSEGGSANKCVALIKEGCELNEVWDEKTSVYLLMDYIATHKKSYCGVATEILQAMLERKDFNIKQSYRDLLPPFNYLLRRNYEYLHNSFSKDYLSDEVLRMCIEYGAPVTSYNQKGGSLMDFAINTENESMQAYLYEKGINLRHEDQQGEDAVFKLIADGKLDIIRSAIEQKRISIDINSLKNETNTFSHNKELYDYLAVHCANQANTYEDITLFRHRFQDKANLTQQKYEALARNEVNICTNYDMIVHCERRYPDLTSITAPKKLKIAEAEAKAIATINDVKVYESHYPNLRGNVDGKKDSIYKADCIALQETYNQMKVALQNQSMNVNPSISSIFTVNYSNYYDPQQQLTLANAMNTYVQVLEIAQKKDGPYYTPTNSFGNIYESDMRQLNKALSYCHNIQKYELSSSWLTNIIQSKINTLTNHYNECMEAVKMVDAVTSVPQPTNKFVSGRDYCYSWKDFSFKVTNFSTKDYNHYVVRCMKGGKLSGRFIKGYGSMEGAIIAGWAAATYGFARTEDRPQWIGGILSALLLQKMGHALELDIYKAKQQDELEGIIDGWIGN